jgi:hypothetical protein
MYVDYANKLERLKQRRIGYGGTMDAAFAEATAILKDMTLEERYQSRTTSSALQYALGCMQEVDPAYTKNSYAEGERVRNQVAQWMTSCGTRVSFEYQGSLPLNVHIRGVSDVDLLVMHEEFVTLDWSGPKAHTYIRLGNTTLVDMQQLRGECETVLDRRFPEAKVEKKTKSIRISEGSLRRDIDVVPAHWHDTAAYQTTGFKHDREIRILDTSVPTTLGNRPFLHMKRIEDKDSTSGGGLKKAIRLLKNLRNDATPEIKLTSYDIAAIAWHFDATALRFPDYLETVLLASIQAQLAGLLVDPSRLIRLDVPDGSRKIIDSADKFGAINHLAKELDQLILDIATSVLPTFTPDGPLSSARFLAQANISL